MRDFKRIDKILTLIKKIWKKNSDQRLGQLLFNYTRFGTRTVAGTIVDIFHYEDDDIMKDLKMSLKEIK